MKKHRMLPLPGRPLAVVLTAVGLWPAALRHPRRHVQAGWSVTSGVSTTRLQPEPVTGMKRAAKVLKIPYRAVESRSSATTCRHGLAGRSGYNIVISAGSCCRMRRGRGGSVPEHEVRDHDQGVEAFKRKHKNVEGLTYATTENSYVMGALRRSSARLGSKASARWAAQDPARRHVPRRLQGGRAEVRPRATVTIGYSQDFLDQAKCKSIAQNQIDGGSQVVFPVAGPCGLGALDAAKRAAAGASASTSTSRTSAATSSRVL